MTIVTKEAVLEKLKEVYDPEIPVNVVDLGLIYGVDVKENNEVHVKMTLTAPGCGMGPYIAQQAECAISEIEDLEDIQKTANERYITAQILSQKLDNVYRLFEVNLATTKNDSKNEEANVDFINSLTDILFTYERSLL